MNIYELKSGIDLGMVIEVYGIEDWEKGQNILRKSSPLKSKLNLSTLPLNFHTFIPLYPIPFLLLIVNIMETTPEPKKKRHLFRRFLFWAMAILIVILSSATFYVSRNLNRLVSEAIMKGFNSNAISDVYELKFEKLRINIFSGNIRVLNVLLQPRQKPIHDYPYINSSFRLETKKILLEDVQLMTMVKTGKLELKRIEI